MVSRRELLRRGAAMGVAGSALGAAHAKAVAFADPPWLHQPGAGFTNYGQPAADQRRVIRWIAANPAVPGNGVSWCPLHELEGTLVPNGLHFERHHHGVPIIDAGVHRLTIHGLVDQSISYAIEDLLRYPRQSVQTFIECGGNSAQGWNSEPTQAAAGHWHGLASCSEWTGIPLKILLDEAGVKSAAGWVIAEGADAFRMNISVPVEKCYTDGLLALYQNGERLRPENGYPMRLLLPGWEGVTQVKWVHKLELTEQPVMARNETARYTDLLADGTARQFSFSMEVKSVITHPSPGKFVHPGFNEVTGLAWSGNGAIRRVEVSFDGGANWRDTQLDQPVRSRCFTRFRIPWEWGGKTATLVSRAHDDSGAVQPDRATLVGERGTNSAYHYNATVMWEVDSDGEVIHVYA